MPGTVLGTSPAWSSRGPQKVAVSHVDGAVRDLVDQRMLEWWLCAGRMLSVSCWPYLWVKDTSNDAEVHFVARYIFCLNSCISLVSALVQL